MRPESEEEWPGEINKSEMMLYDGPTVGIQRAPTKEYVDLPKIFLPDYAHCNTERS